MSDHGKKGETWQVPTIDGRLLDVRCPICSNDRFLSAKPQLRPGAGFVHVTVGYEVEKGVKGRLLGMSTKSKHCSNCGFILKFTFFEDEEKRDGGS